MNVDFLHVILVEVIRVLARHKAQRWFGIGQ